VFYGIFVSADELSRHGLGVGHVRLQTLHFDVRYNFVRDPISNNLGTSCSTILKTYRLLYQ